MSKVFINVCSSVQFDQEIAGLFFTAFQRIGFEPFLVSKSLLAGQSRAVEINKAIMASDFFLSLVSGQSLRTSGEHLRQQRKALAKMRELPEKQIFIIPVIIDELDRYVYEDNSPIGHLMPVRFLPDWQKALGKIFQVMGAQVPANLSLPSQQ